MLVPGKKFTVFSIRKKEQGTIWVRVGNAVVNRDGSMNVWLDVIPFDGTLHGREAAERKGARSSTNQEHNYASETEALVGGHS